MTDKQKEVIQKMCEVLDYDFYDLKNMATKEAREWVKENMDDYNYYRRKSMIDKLLIFAKRNNLGIIFNKSKEIYFIDENIWEITNDTDLTDHLVLGFIATKNEANNKTTFEVSIYNGNCLIKYNKEELQAIIELLEELNND